MDAIAEIACSEAATLVIDDIAKKHKMNPLHIASYVPGIAHNHPPCEHIVESCTYCKRNGNVFSNARENSPPEQNDVMSVYKRKLIVIFEDMKNELQNTVQHIWNTADNDELEKMLLEAFED